MNIAKLIEGTATLTKEWNEKSTEVASDGTERRKYFRREHFIEFATPRWKDLGKDDIYIGHMVREYVNTSEPIFTRMYSLDMENKRIVLEYIDWYTDGLDMGDVFIRGVETP